MCQRLILSRKMVPIVRHIRHMFFAKMKTANGKSLFFIRQKLRIPWRNKMNNPEKEIKILAIESSCDETAAAVVVNGRDARIKKYVLFIFQRNTDM